ncbi:MAG: Fic family protein [Oscillospiraceae bacterium]|nr:Fic family protein [Oscillospiraceae bacterium]
MKKFDYSFLENGMLPARIINHSVSIGVLREKEQELKEKYQTIFTKLESIAKLQSVKGSNAIEGIITTDSRIEAIVYQNSAPLNHAETEIAGYRDALNLVHENFRTIQITENEILNLHKIMLSDNEIIGGKYKREDNAIIAIDAFGNRTIRFVPVPAIETPFAMEQLILAYMDARQNSNINQLFLIPCFILDFLCVHPFDDGNGRISRLLSLLLLYKNGFDAGKYISFEEQINKYKSSYYNALKLSSQAWHENANDYFAFMEYFISTLFACYKELDKRFAVISDRKISKKNRIETIIFNSITPISKKELIYILPDTSISTIEKVLLDLQDQGIIEKIGTYRNAKYIKKF